MSTSKHLWLLPAMALSLAFAPAFAATCYTPPLRTTIDTPMSALPPPGLCIGKQIKLGSVTYCVSCGTTGTPVGSGCVMCNVGYSYVAASKQCCKTGWHLVPQPK